MKDVILLVLLTLIEILIMCIGTVICTAAIKGHINFFNKIKGKGKFTKLNLDDNGGIWLQFEYKKRFGKISGNAQSEITEYLKEDCKGLTEVSVTRNKPNELLICMKFEEINDERFSLSLDEQEEALTYLCSGY